MKYNLNKVGKTALVICLGLTCSFGAMAQDKGYIVFKSKVPEVEAQLNIPNPNFVFEQKQVEIKLKDGETDRQKIKCKSDLPIVVLAENLVIFAYAKPGKTVELEFFKNKDGTLDYRFAKDDVINNFSKQFHQKVMPLFRGQISEELIEKTRKEQQAIYDKIAPKLNKNERLAARYMMEGRLVTLELNRAFQQRDMTIVKKPYRFPKGFISLYPDNFSLASNLFGLYLKESLGLDVDKADPQTMMEKAIAYTDNQTFLDVIFFRFGQDEIKKGDAAHKKKFLAYLKERGIGDMAYEKLAAIKADSFKNAPTIGDPARFVETLVPYDANKNLGNIMGKKVFIDNWATWCGPCMKSIKTFLKNKPNIPDNVAILFVSHDFNEKAWKKFLKENPKFDRKNVFHFYNSEGRESDYATYWKLEGLPRYFVVGESGTVIEDKPISHPGGEGFQDYLYKLSKK